jgi:hypothetical protein
VLPGFRDIDAEADLDAWFADRDVQAYIDQQDRIQGRQRSSPELGAGWPDISLMPPMAAVEGLEGLAEGPNGDSADAASDGEDEEDDDDDLWDGPGWSWPSFELPRLRLPALHLPLLHLPAPAIADLPRWALPTGAAVVLAAGLGGWLLLRPRSEPVKPLPVQPLAQPAPSATPPVVAPALPLTAADPSDAQLQTLLEAWLKAKAALLAGQTPAQPLDAIARPMPVERLQEQLRANAAAGARDSVNATITGLRSLERSPRRIAGEATLTSRDRLRHRGRWGGLTRVEPSRRSERGQH